MYWITSSLFSIVQVSTLRVPKIRRALGIPLAKIYAPPRAPVNADSSKVTMRKRTSIR